MISIAEARSSVLQWAWTKSLVRRPLLRSPGLVLAENVVSDIDSPPFDKSLVDGFAVCDGDQIRGGTELEVIARVTAGMVPSVAVRPGTAVQVMTGAPIPEGADAVVMVEQTSDDALSIKEGIRIDAEQVVAGQNVMRRGAAMTRGTVVLPRGHVVRAVDVGLLAEVGCSDVSVIEPARVAVLSTGDELIDARHMPGVGAIRNSNGPLLCALAESLHAKVTNLGIVRDQLDALGQAIDDGLQHDLLVLSGGVSAGVRDLVPQVLQQRGVEQVFHKVHLRPGKPMWFGQYRDGNHRCLVFGLPGNPVGSLVCFQLFVAPVLRTLCGHEPAVVPLQDGRMAVTHQHQSDRPTYHPARVEWCGGRGEVTPIPWQGSADQRAIAQANALVFFPPGKRQFTAGEAVQVEVLES